METRTCREDDCGRPFLARGWCNAHYKRWWRNSKMEFDAPVRVIGPSEPAVNGTRRCNVCGNVKPFDQFDRMGNSEQRRPQCKPCRGDLRRLEQYGISGARYRQMFNKQQGLCAACHHPETGLTSLGRPRLLSVDHDHACCPGKKSCGKCIRGLLCRRCNVTLGWVEDTPDLLLNLVDYLKEVGTNE